jgi:hypothetical protein
MARRTEHLTITAEGRDKGKVFILTEMPADQAERWAIRALLALTKSGVELPDDALTAGMAGLAAVGVRALAGLNYDDAGPLLDEMLTCAKLEHSPGQPPLPLTVGGVCQVEEVSTFWKIRMALLTLHTGFSMPEVPPTSGQQP